MNRFIETIRFENGKFHLLEYHQERVNRTFATFYPQHVSLNLEEILPNIEWTGKHKFRLEYDATAHQFNNKLYKPKRIKNIKLVETNIDYGFKFSDRSELQKLLLRPEYSP